MKKVGVLLVNLGTPDKPEKKSVRKYLREFLMDKQVINLPFPLRFFLVNFIIIPKRLTRVTELYQSVWQEDSPIREILFKQVAGLEKQFQGQESPIFFVKGAMTYGSPSILESITALQKIGIDVLVVLPLYPQFSKTTTTPVMIRVNEAIKQIKFHNPIHFINDYFEHPLYTEALSQQIQIYWQQNAKPEVLLLSYHGIPLSYAEAGDPYLDQCKQTTNLLKEKLSATGVRIIESYQSRVTSEEWAKPYTEEMILDLAKQGIKHLAVCCPGFAADCLETLDEIAIEYKKVFLEAGGDDFFCFPALNDSDNHLKLFKSLVIEALGQPTNK
jgi:ferrochelatase